MWSEPSETIALPDSNRSYFTSNPQYLDLAYKHIFLSNNARRFWMFWKSQNARGRGTTHGHYRELIYVRPLQFLTQV